MLDHTEKDHFVLFILNVLSMEFRALNKYDENISHPRNNKMKNNKFYFCNID